MQMHLFLFLPFWRQISTIFSLTLFISITFFFSLEKVSNWPQNPSVCLYQRTCVFCLPGERTVFVPAAMGLKDCLLSLSVCGCLDRERMTLWSRLREWGMFCYVVEYPIPQRFFFFQWNSLKFSRNNFLNATVISEIVRDMARRKGRNKLMLPE